MEYKFIKFRKRNILCKFEIQLQLLFLKFIIYKTEFTNGNSFVIKFLKNIIAFKKRKEVLISKSFHLKKII